jgi:hypothetical protein
MRVVEQGTFGQPCGRQCGEGGGGQPKLSCQKWFDRYLAEQREQGRDAVDAVAVREAGMTAGYSLSSLYVAANKRGLKGTTWSLTG